MWLISKSSCTPSFELWYGVEKSEKKQIETDCAAQTVYATFIIRILYGALSRCDLRLARFSEKVEERCCHATKGYRFNLPSVGRG